MDDADTPENNDDPLLLTLDDIKRKYFMDEPEWVQFNHLLLIITREANLKLVAKHGDHGQLGAAEFLPGPKASGFNVGQLSKDDNLSELDARGARIIASLNQEGQAKYVNHALAMMIAEGNLKMVKVRKWKWKWEWEWTQIFHHI